MRIIAGKYKGRNIVAPKGREVRPTSDRVREAMFSSINSIYGQLDGANVLDAFAGSGAFGLECLSRGANQVIFCEKNFKTFQNLKDNVQSLNIADVDAICINADNQKFNFSRLTNDNKFNLAFFDPPYKYDSECVINIVNNLKSNNSIGDNFLIIYEHDQNNSLQKFEELEVVCTKTYGDTSVDYAKLAGGHNE